MDRLFLDAAVEVLLGGTKELACMDKVEEKRPVHQEGEIAVVVSDGWQAHYDNRKEEGEKQAEPDMPEMTIQ
jgi:hypothetical protein